MLLGRERVLEDVWVNLADAGLELNWFEISHFDAEQRVAYVDARVRGDRDASNSAYIEARDAVLGALAGTVQSEQAESFVGYAPVLDAVVALLRRGNLVEVKNTFQDRLLDVQRISVLLDVLARLLDRERLGAAPLA